MQKRKTSIKLSQKRWDGVESHRKNLGIKSWAKAHEDLWLKKDKKIEKLEATNEQQNVDIEKYREMLMLNNLDPSNPQKDEACDYLDYDRKGQLICRNPNPPIKTRDLTSKACMKCKKLRKKEKTEKRQTSALDKKLSKKYCPQLGDYLTPLQSQSKCTKCKVDSRTFLKWAECERKYQLQFSKI